MISKEILVKFEEILVKFEEILVEFEEMLVKFEEILVKVEEILSWEVTLGNLWRFVFTVGHNNVLEDFLRLR